MTCLLNEEIRVIQMTITHMKRAIPLESDSGKREKMKKDVKELQSILNDKLGQCEDFKG